MPLHYKILMFVSTLVWLFPPIRQYKNNYFWLFLLLALTDPITILLGRNFTIPFSQTYVVCSVLFFVSVIEIRKLNFLKIIVLVAVTAAGFISLFNYWEFSYLFISIALFLVLLIIVKNSFSSVIKSGYINIFHIVLTFYIISDILKFWYYIQYFSAGIGFFYVTSILQIFIGLFFAIYAENAPKLLIKIIKSN